MAKLTAKKVREGAKEYFDQRRAFRPALEQRDMLKDDGSGHMVQVLDEYGHPQKEFVQATNAAGEPVTETVWFAPPTVAGLCLHLGIDTTTWYRWMRVRNDAKPELLRLKEAVMEAEATIEEYLTERSFEKVKNRGAIAQLERRYWNKGTEDVEQEQQERDGELSLHQRMELLREMGLTLPGEQEGKM